MYNLKVIKSGNRIEIYKINNYIINEYKEDEGYRIIDKMLQDSINRTDDNERNEPTLDNKQKAREKSLTKARNNIMRLVQCNQDMKIFLTLTFASEADYKESKAKLNIFFTKLRKVYKNLKYIWVLEYGDKNGRLHFHVLCNIPIGIKLANSNEKKSEQHKNLEKSFEKNYWNYGWVDIRGLSQCEDNVSVGLYISSYIVKGMKDINLEGYRIYDYSHRTLERPIEIKLYSKDTIEDLLKMYPDYKVRYQSNYDIGYVDYRREHKGNVIYLDLVKK